MALIVVSVASVLLAHSISSDLALRDAVSRGRTFAVGVSGPLVDDGLRSGDAESIAVFDEVMANRLQETSMVHIKVWDSRGTVLWSDEPELRGRAFHLDSEVARLFESGGVVGYVSDLDKPENVEERGEGKLLEVYAAARSRTGEPVVIESYWSTEHLAKNSRAVMLRIAPLSLGALLLFALVVFPLAWSLARRVERVQSENRALLQHSLAASDLERRRIARDLHDGVMQDVSGAAYALSAVATSIREESELPRRLVEDVGTLIRRIGDSLRSTLADIYPANLAAEGLVPAVEELAVRASEAGVSVRIDVLGMADESLEVVRLSYRVIREGLRNVIRHAQATNAEVLAAPAGDSIYLSVDDDGQGPGGSVAGEGHVGLELLRDTMLDVGGTLVIEERAGGGTHLAVTFPRNLATS